MTGLLLDDDLDILINHGHLQTGDTTTQTALLLLETALGEWKEHPLLGANARSQLGGNTDPFWAASTRRMMKACGLDVQRISISNGEIIIT